MSDWRTALEQEWQRRAVDLIPEVDFPLMQRTFDTGEIVAAVESLLTGQLTMSRTVLAFEREFAHKVGAPYAVMVNSGSSANLLALAVATNPARSRRLEPGDEVLVPAVCWATSVWPLIQMGLRPVLVDSDPATLNIRLDDARRRLTPRTRGLLMVHVLGNSCAIDDLLCFAEEHGLLLVEDTCESLGSVTEADGRYLGTFGAFGTFSFYFSHHMTTGEGGMVVCRTQEDYDLLRCLRAHGWSRDLSGKTAVEQSHPDIDPRFLFVNAGYNLRPMELQAAIGLCQLKQLDAMNRGRRRNWIALRTALQNHSHWRGQFRFTEPARGLDPAWFGFAILLADGRDRASYLRRLGATVENRPIISGNFARQPGLALFGLKFEPASYPGAEAIHTNGFFIGLPAQQLPPDRVTALADALLLTLPAL